MSVFKICDRTVKIFEKTISIIKYISTIVLNEHYRYLIHFCISSALHRVDAQRHIFFCFLNSFASFHYKWEVHNLASNNLLDKHFLTTGH